MRFVNSVINDFESKEQDVHLKWICLVDRKIFLPMKLKLRSKSPKFQEYWRLKFQKIFLRRLIYENLTVVKGLMSIEWGVNNSKEFLLSVVMTGTGKSLNVLNHALNLKMKIRH